MISLLHRLLLKLSPELAHHIVITSLRLFQKILCLFSHPPKSFPAIRVGSLPKLTFSNRLGLAAGFDKNAECFFALSRMGFGFVEVGTVTPLPQEGNPKPRLWRVAPNGLINRMGFNNCGVEQFKKNIDKYRSYCSVPLLANIGKNKDTPNESAFRDYEMLFSELSHRVDGFVVNISSPNTVGLRDLQSVAFLEKIESLAPSMPILVKLAPDLDKSSLSELFQKIKSSSRFSGCVLTNTSREIARDEYQRTEGGYSGVKLFEKSLQIVAMGREILGGEKTIIAVGGVDSLERAKKMREAGADLVEIYTSFVYHGPKWVRELGRGLSN